MYEDDTIDRSQWLPRGTPILTPERQAMLGVDLRRDAEGNVDSAEIKTINLMSLLHMKGIIDDVEVYDGRTYQVWRSKATAHFTNEIIPYDPLFDKPSTESLGEYGFILVSQRLAKHDCDILAHAMDTEATLLATRLKDLITNDPKRHKSAVDSLENTYHRSFARLVHVMKMVREELSAKKKAMKEQTSS